MCGSSEVGTALVMMLRSLPKDVKAVSLFCDSCGGQNQNQFIPGALMYGIEDTHIECIDVKYLVSGHTYMEVDNMHSLIERAKKTCVVEVPDDWYNIIRMACHQPYTILPITHESILDLKTLMLPFNTKINTDGGNVKWGRIRWIPMEKQHPFVLQYKTSFDEEGFQTVDLRRKKKTRRSADSEQHHLEIIPKYNARLPISAAKKKDLLKLVKTGSIDEKHRKYYESLPCDEYIVDSLAEPDICESDSDNE